MSSGILSIVATPIGNMEDITLRALRTLRECDYVLCEDTRVTGKLFQYHKVEAKLKRYDAHASESVHQQVLADLEAGKQVALVSDAGTPGISDPGVRLIEQVRSSAVEIKIEVIPGPSAVTAAVSIAGLAGNAFTFLGYAPQKKGRQTFFNTLTSYKHPVVFFESTHRIRKTLESLAAIATDQNVLVARELTKLYEEVLSGTPAEIIEIMEEDPVKQKGEFVVIFAN